MYDYILFDLDGTLTDPKEGITKCVQYALAAMGIDEPDLEVLVPFIGPPLKESFMEFYGMSDEDGEKSVEKYRERFNDTGIYENIIYDGIPQMLKKLKESGKTLAVASSKPTVYVERILEYFEIRQYFDVVVGSELDGRRTDKAEVVEEALKQLFGEGAADIEDKKKRTAMVGDRKFDVYGAKSEGVTSVAVAYGHGPMDELKIAKPDFIVRTVAELENLLLRKKDQPKTKPLKVWPILYPALIFYFGRAIGENLGVYLLAMLLNKIPMEIADKLVIWAEKGVSISALSGNGTALVAAISFLFAGVVSWFLFGKTDLKKAAKDRALKHSLLKAPLDYAALLAGATCVGLGVNFVLSLVGFTDAAASYTDAATVQYSATVWVGLLLNVLLVPFAEELIFRGVLYNRLKESLDYRRAIIVSALFFAIYHQNIVSGVYAFLLGCVIAFCYEKTGRFWVPVLVHALCNAAAYICTVCELKANWIVAAVLVLAGVFLIMYINKPTTVTCEE